MKVFLMIMTNCLLMYSTGAAIADDTAVVATDAPSSVTTKSAANLEGEKKFAGLSFGVGISLTFDTGSDSRIEAASIVDGIVRVDNENDKVARVMLESHYFFVPEKKFMGLDGVDHGSWGWGPFVALQPGTDEIIEAIAVGLMVGFRRPEESGNSWNIGIGYVTDPNVNILGDGFTENQPPPGNETAIRLKEVSQDGVVLLFSFSF